MKSEWYSVRCIFKHPHRDDMTKHNLYEERITIWKATSFEEAIAKAEEEAKSYAEPDCTYLGIAQAYNIFSNNIRGGIEVFSLMRESNYNPKKYLDTYFDNGLERQTQVE